jgi:membrane fusion protein (multidrug efflux system)
MLEAAEATVRRADVDLGYTKVLAPENGLIAKTEVFAGTLVGRGQSTLLTRISRIDPIHARFSVPERDYLAYSRKNKEAGRETDDKADKFELLLADGTVHAHKGHLVFVDSSVDPVTGTILIEASFPNPGDLIRPGAYCRVRAAIETKKGAILVPQRCVQELQGVFSVAAVGTDGSVNLRMVKPSERIGSLWVIDSGLKAGDRVIVEGAQKVRPGAKVNATLVPIEEGSTAPKGAAPPGGGGTDEKKSTPEK